MRKISMAMVAFIPAAAALIPAAGAQAASTSSSSHEVRAVGSQRADGTSNGCPSGDVCLYTASGWYDGAPYQEFYHYGCYPLIGEHGPSVIFNYQTGGASAFAYYDGCCGSQAAS